MPKDKRTVMSIPKRAVMINAGIERNSIARTCSSTSTLDKEDASTVLSDNGDSLSPKYAPDRTAPATSGNGIPSPSPIAIMAIPAVPAVPQDVPVATDMTEQMINVASRKILGCINSRP